MSNFESRVKQSWTTYDNDLIQKETVFKNANQKLAYMFLHSYANAHKIFPSMDSIAVAICASTRTAMRIVQELEEMTFIEVKREAGKSNNYILHDYFEIAEKLTSDKLTRVKKSQKKTGETDEKQDERTGENLSPVKDCHQTSDKMSPVPVTKCHPITNIKKKNEKEKLTKLTKLVSSENVLFYDSVQKDNFPDIPYDQLKADLIQDAENGKVVLNTVKQYTALMNGRIRFCLEKASKKPEQAQIIELFPNDVEITLREKSNAFKALLLENMTEDERKEVTPPPPEQTPEELSEKQKEIQRLMDELKKDK